MNRVVFFVGALLAGHLATLLGYRLILAIGALVFLAALVPVFSPLFVARHGDRL